MTSSLDKLNLRPGEKRLLVGIGIAIFVVLNFWLVFPRFGEFGRVRAETARVQREISTFQKEIDKKATYQKLLSELEGQGSQVIDQERALQLQMTVQSQQLATGINITRYDPVGRPFNAPTNAFFDEQSLVVSYDTGYKQLVNFLVGLAEHESMIRVRQMDVKRDPSNQRLQGNITLVASYQKTRATPNATAAQTPAPTPKP